MMLIKDQNGNQDNLDEYVSFLKENNNKKLARIRSDSLSAIQKCHRRSRINIAQKIILLIGAVLITVCSLFPCWSVSFKGEGEMELHRRFIYEPSAKLSAIFIKKWINKDANVRISSMPEARIDYYRLLVEYAMVVSLITAMFFLVGRRE